MQVVEIMYICNISLLKLCLPPTKVLSARSPEGEQLRGPCCGIEEEMALLLPLPGSCLLAAASGGKLLLFVKRTKAELRMAPTKEGKTGGDVMERPAAANTLSLGCSVSISTPTVDDTKKRKGRQIVVGPAGVLGEVVAQSLYDHYRAMKHSDSESRTFVSYLEDRLRSMAPPGLSLVTEEDLRSFVMGQHEASSPLEAYQGGLAPLSYREGLEKVLQAAQPGKPGSSGQSAKLQSKLEKGFIKWASSNATGTTESAPAVTQVKDQLRAVKDMLTRLLLSLDKNPSVTLAGAEVLEIVQQNELQVTVVIDHVGKRREAWDSFLEYVSLLHEAQSTTQAPTTRQAAARLTPSPPPLSITPTSAASPSYTLRHTDSTSSSSSVSLPPSTSRSTSRSISRASTLSSRASSQSRPSSAVRKPSVLGDVVEAGFLNWCMTEEEGDNRRRLALDHLERTRSLLQSMLQTVDREVEPMTKDEVLALWRANVERLRHCVKGAGAEVTWNSFLTFIGAEDQELLLAAQLPVKKHIKKERHVARRARKPVPPALSLTSCEVITACMTTNFVQWAIERQSDKHGTVDVAVAAEQYAKDVKDTLQIMLATLGRSIEEPMTPDDVLKMWRENRRMLEVVMKQQSCYTYWNLFIRFVGGLEADLIADSGKKRSAATAAAGKASPASSTAAAAAAAAGGDGGAGGDLMEFSSTSDSQLLAPTTFDHFHDNHLKAAFPALPKTSIVRGATTSAAGSTSSTPNSKRQKLEAGPWLLEMSQHPVRVDDVDNDLPFAHVFDDAMDTSTQSSSIMSSSAECSRASISMFDPSTQWMDTCSSASSSHSHTFTLPGFWFPVASPGGYVMAPPGEHVHAHYNEASPMQQDGQEFFAESPARR